MLTGRIAKLRVTEVALTTSKRQVVGIETSRSIGNIGITSADHLGLSWHPKIVYLPT